MVILFADVVAASAAHAASASSSADATLPRPITPSPLPLSSSLRNQSTMASPDGRRGQRKVAESSVRVGVLSCSDRAERGDEV
uniref:Secreted protein n=1 Tax=Arundo donax TaxID=35708 RepID=A0A0A9F977_ARUDO